MRHHEREAVLQCVIKTAAGRIPIIAGCGVPSTAETIDLVRQAKDHGMAAALIVSPSYVKPTARGLKAHFQAVHEAVDLPIIIYNNPGRSVVDLSIDLIGELSQLPRMVGLKDSHPDMSRVIGLRRLVPADFSLLCGDDIFTTAYLANGGHGCISVSANVSPRLCQQLMQAWQEKDLDRFMTLRDQLDVIHRALLTEVNPTTIKYAVSYLGRCQNEVRLPLTPVLPETERIIQEALGGGHERQRQQL